MVREALKLGALGYVLKQDAPSDLLPGIERVLEGKRFVSPGLQFGEETHDPAPGTHEILFCSEDSVLLDALTLFIATALNAGNAAIVWATEAHRNNLLERLRGQGVDIGAAVQRGTYLSSDVAEVPDPVHILLALKGLSEAAAKAGKEHPRVAVCGERAGRLWGEGKTDVAIRLEQLFNELARSQDIDILCVYPMPAGQEYDAFKTICGEHTTVSFR